MRRRLLVLVLLSAAAWGALGIAVFVYVDRKLQQAAGWFA